MTAADIVAEVERNASAVADSAYGVRLLARLAEQHETRIARLEGEDYGAWTVQSAELRGRIERLEQLVTADKRPGDAPLPPSPVICKYPDCDIINGHVHAAKTSGDSRGAPPEPRKPAGVALDAGAQEAPRTLDAVALELFRDLYGGDPSCGEDRDTLETIAAACMSAATIGASEHHAKLERICVYGPRREWLKGTRP